MWTITEDSARALKLEAGKNDLIKFDAHLRGFGVRVRRLSDRSISKRYIYQYKAHGKQRRMDLGAVVEMKAQKAREIAREYESKIRAGGDPAEDRKIHRNIAVVTLGDVIKRYCAERLPALRENSQVASRYSLEECWKPLHGRPIAEIRRSEVSLRVSDLAKERGPVTANRARAALSALFAWWMKFDDSILGNPVKGSHAEAPSVARDRALTDPEAAVVWLATPDSDFGKIIRLLLLTGCRRNEIGELKWSEVDLHARTITLPAERTKNKTRHVVPLTDRALEILQSQPRRLNNENVFGQGAQGYSGWGQAQNLIRKAVGDIPHWTIHDTRRTVRTGLGKIGVEPHICEAVINHLPAQLIRNYDTNKYETQKRIALERWETHLLTAIAQATGANVTPLRQEL
jgi:integrase